MKSSNLTHCIVSRLALTLAVLPPLVRDGLCRCQAGRMGCLPGPEDTQSVVGLGLAARWRSGEGR